MNTLNKISGAIIASFIIAVPLNLYAGHTNLVLEATLDGASQVDASDVGKKRNTDSNKQVGDKNGKGEAYVFGIDGDPKTLCYFLQVKKIQMVPVKGGMAAHIHKGKANENGPVVAALAGPEDGNAADCLTEGEKGKFPTGETVANILAHPENYYINVHNPKFPKGAIRGQLRFNLDKEKDDHTHDEKEDSQTNS